jgi:hypothetical protein
MALLSFFKKIVVNWVYLVVLSFLKNSQKNFNIFSTLSIYNNFNQVSTFKNHYSKNINIGISGISKDIQIYQSNLKK